MSNPPAPPKKTCYYNNNISQELLTVKSFSELGQVLPNLLSGSTTPDVDLIVGILNKLEDLTSPHHIIITKNADDANDPDGDDDRSMAKSIGEHFARPFEFWFSHFNTNNNDAATLAQVGKILFHDEKLVDELFLSCFEKMQNAWAEEIDDDLNEINHHHQNLTTTFQGCHMIYFLMLLDTSYSKIDRSALVTSNAILKTVCDALTRLRDLLLLSATTPSSSSSSAMNIDNKRNHTCVIVFNVTLVMTITRRSALNFITFPGAAALLRDLFVFFANHACVAARATDSVITPFQYVTRVICNICYSTKKACRTLNESPNAVEAIIAGLHRCQLPSVILIFAQAVAALTWASTPEVKDLFASPDFVNGTLSAFYKATDCRTVEHLCLIVNNSTWESLSVTAAFCTEECFSIFFKIVDRIVAQTSTTNANTNTTSTSTFSSFLSKSIINNNNSNLPLVVNFRSETPQQIAEAVTWLCGAVKNLAMNPMGMRLFSRPQFVGLLFLLYPVVAKFPESLLFLEVTISYLVQDGGDDEDENLKNKKITIPSATSYKDYVSKTAASSYSSEFSTTKSVPLEGLPRGFGFGFVNMFNASKNAKEYKTHSSFAEDKELALKILKEAKIRMEKYAKTLVIQYGTKGTISAFESMRVFFEDDDEKLDDVGIENQEQKKIVINNEKEVDDEDADDREDEEKKPVTVNGKKDLEWILGLIDKNYSNKKDQK